MIVGRQQAFSVVPTLAPSIAVTWSVDEPSCGSITAAGLFTAPSTAGTCHVRLVVAGQSDVIVPVTVVGAPVATSFLQPDSEFFVAPPLFGFAYHTVIDFDHDGYPDVLAGWGPLEPRGPGRIQALRNDHAGRFTDETPLVFGGSSPTPTHARNFVTADFTGDGVLDVFVADHGLDGPPFPGAQSLLLVGTSDGRLLDETSARLPASIAFTHDACAGDVNGDGAVDLYLANIWAPARVGPTIYVNDGTGHFSSQPARIPASVSDLTFGYTSCAFADVDSDGDSDLVLGIDGYNSLNTTPLLLNDGSGRFTFAPGGAMPSARPLTPIEIHVDILDFNKDGAPDVLRTTTSLEPFYSTRCLELLVNEGDGTFRDRSDLLAQPCRNIGDWLIARTAEFDGSGWPGIVAGSQSGGFAGSEGGGGTDALLLVRGDAGAAQAGIVDRSSSMPASRVYDVLPADFDADGDVDVLVVSGGGYFTLVRNALRP